LGTTSFLVYYMRETRMYTLLMSLAALSMWAYVRWLRRPEPGRLIACSVSMAALSYTQYCGMMIPIAQCIHLLLTRPRQSGHWFLAAGGGALLYLPWLPTLLKQIQTRPDGPLALPTPTNWPTIVHLFNVLSGGAGTVTLIPYLLGKALPRLRQYRHEMLLLILWVATTPTIVLSINAWKPHAYEPRYVIGILPAVTLLMAYGIRHMMWKWLASITLAGLVSTNIIAFSWLWPPKTPWGLTNAADAVNTRLPGEPTLVMIVEPYGLESHYERHLNLRNADAIDLSGRRHSPDDMRRIISALPLKPSAWIMMPNNLGETWAAAAILDSQRQVGYRNNAAHLLFYRFDHGPGTELTFRFGGKLRYEQTLFSDTPVIQPRTPHCVEITLTTLASLDGTYSYGVHLVDTSNTLITQYDTGLGAHPMDEHISLTPCLDIPDDLDPGVYYLHLVVYDWANGERLPVLEGKAEIPWGDALVFGAVTLE
jgi:hypothetical protein